MSETNVEKDDPQQLIVINPMVIAPKDGTPVLLKFRDDLSKHCKRDKEYWEGVVFVGKNHNTRSQWMFAAPVGMSGFPDAWFEGWYDIKDL